MRTAHIDREGAELDVEGDRLVVRVDGERKGTTPLALLERLVVSGSARLTSRLLARLQESDVGLVVERRGRAGATMALSRGGADRDLRIAQYEILVRPELRLGLAARIVRDKIAAGAALLREMGEAGAIAAGPLARIVARMEAAAREAGDARVTPGLEVLRGREGSAAAAFFPIYATAFAPALDFSDRNRRPPRDPVNVCLSLGYTLAYVEAQRACAHAGLDPTLGLLHDAIPGRDALAADLMEPARAAIERFVWSLFREGDLRVEDFSGRGPRGCTLGKTGRRAFYRAFSERCAPDLTDIVTAQARGLAGALREPHP